MKNIKKTVKKKLLNSDTGILLFYKIRVIRERLALVFIDDYSYIKKEYKKRYDQEINLKYPKFISEKLQWLKLFYRNEQMPICSDKYDIRFYLKKYGYEHLLNEIIVIYESEKEIDQLDIESLPKSFVAKATHGSGWNLIVKNKNEIDWNLWKKIFKQWLKLDLTVFGREWNYKNIKPRILIEKYIDQTPMIDYKVTCFNGEPQYILVLFNEAGKRYMDIYDMDWNKISEFSTAFEPSNYDHDKPECLKEILDISRTLSKEFPYVRMDFYYVENTIILSEMTFFSTSGFLSLIPKMAEYYGDLLILPEPNYNIELYNKING